MRQFSRETGAVKYVHYNRPQQDSCQEIGGILNLDNRKNEALLKIKRVIKTLSFRFNCQRRLEKTAIVQERQAESLTKPRIVLFGYRLPVANVDKYR